MTHIRPLQFGEFADVVYNGQRGELGLDKTIAPIVEALEAIVVFELTEDGLRFYGAHTSMIQSAFTSQHSLRFVPI